MSIVRRMVKASCLAVVPRQMLLVRGPRPGGRGGSASPRRCEVALTFDDGPEPETTPALLELLERYGIGATFFLIGEKARRYRGIVQQMVAAGHELGNHSYTHSEPRSISTTAFLDEVRRTRDLLEDIGGRPCRLVRPPKGTLTVGKQLGLWRERMTTVLWSVDPRDYRMSAPQQAAQWGAGYVPQGGDIVLLHDNHPWAEVIVRAMVEGGGAGRVEYVGLSGWVG